MLGRNHDILLIIFAGLKKGWVILITGVSPWECPMSQSLSPKSQLLSVFSSRPVHRQDKKTSQSSWRYNFPNDNEYWEREKVFLPSRVGNEVLLSWQPMVSWGGGAGQLWRACAFTSFLPGSLRDFALLQAERKRLRARDSTVMDRGLSEWKRGSAQGQPIKHEVCI